MHFFAKRPKQIEVELCDCVLQTSDVNSAIEASRKCHSAFAAANVILQESQNKEDIIISVKRVINFGFEDVEEFVRLIRVATEAISSQGFSGNTD